MKQLICIYISSFYLFLGIAQDNPWIIGYGSGTANPNGVALYFNADSVHIQGQYRTLGQLEGAISISDTAQNLLFYTNGIAICNHNHDTMSHGNDIPRHYTVDNWKVGGYPFPNSMLILPVPGNSGKYYLLHPYFQMDTITAYMYIMRHYYSMIDMSADNGLGDVVLKNQVFQPDTTTLETMSAVHHANGRDWWIVINKFMSNVYYTYLLDSAGFTGPIVQQAGPPITIQAETAGYGIFTPDGTKYIHAPCYHGIRIMDFDRCTGLFTNTTFVPFKPSLGGIAISHNSQVLYRTTYDSVFQYNLAANDIVASKQCVAVADGFMINGFTANFCYPGLAPNGKIYIGSRNGMGMLHIIDKPDSLGMACNVIQHGIILPMPNATVPTPPNYRLGVLVGSGCDTLVSYQSSLSSHQVKVYPNPAQDKIYIEMPISTPAATFLLYDISGKEVLKQNIVGSKESVFVGKLAKGMYFYEVIFNTKKEYGKLIIE